MPTNYIVWKMGLIPNCGPKKVLFLLVLKEKISYCIDD